MCVLQACQGRGFKASTSRKKCGTQQDARKALAQTIILICTPLCCRAGAAAAAQCSRVIPARIRQERVQDEAKANRDSTNQEGGTDVAVSLDFPALAPKHSGQPRQCRSTQGASRSHPQAHLFKLACGKMTRSIKKRRESRMKVPKTSHTPKVTRESDCKHAHEGTINYATSTKAR